MDHWLAPGFLGAPPLAALLDAMVGLLVLLLGALPGVFIHHRLIRKITWRTPDGIWLGALPGLFLFQVLHLLARRFLAVDGVSWSFVLVACCLGTFLLPQREDRQPPQGLRAWKGRDWGLLVLAGGLLLLLVLPPLARVGEIQDEGIIFRCYFYADMLKHMAITGALDGGGLPPSNPYMSGYRLHYYWLYYMLPQQAMEILGQRGSLLRILIVQQVAVMLLFILAFASVARRLIPGRTGRIVALLGLGLATSYEGIAVLLDSRFHPASFGTWLNYNIDAFTRWRWLHLQVDTLYRSFLFTPPQQLSQGLILVALWIVLWRGGRISRFQAWMVGVAVAGAAAYNFFIGAAVTLAFGLAGVQLAARRGSGRLRWDRFLLAALPVALVAVLAVWMEMPSGVAGRIRTVLAPRTWLLFLPVMGVNFGIYLPLGVVGLLVLRRRNRGTDPEPIPGLVIWPWLLGLCTLIMLTVEFTDNRGDVSLKLGQVMNVQLALLAGAASLPGLRRHRRRYLAVALLGILPAVPTVLMDAYNSLDTSNREYRAVFRPEDVAAIRWARSHLPRDAMVQALPDRDVQRVHLVPSFCSQPSVVVDRHHSLLYLGRGGEFSRRRSIIRRLYETLDLDDALLILREFGIRAVLVGPAERERHPLGTAKFAVLPWLYGQGGTAWFGSRDRPGAALQVELGPEPPNGRGHQPFEILASAQVIRPGEPEGRAALGEGWGPSERSPRGRSYARLLDREARVYLLPQGGPRILKINARAPGLTEEQKLPVQLVLERERPITLGTIEVGPDWGSQRLEIPDGFLPLWSNELGLVLPEIAGAGSTGVSLEVDRIELVSMDSRRIRPTRFATRRDQGVRQLVLTGDGVVSFELVPPPACSLRLEMELTAYQELGRPRYILAVARRQGRLRTLEHRELKPDRPSEPLWIELPSDLQEIHLAAGGLVSEDRLDLRITLERGRLQHRSGTLRLNPEGARQ